MQIWYDRKTRAKRGDYNLNKRESKLPQCAKLQYFSHQLSMVSLRSQSKQFQFDRSQINLSAHKEGFTSLEN